MCNFSSLAIVGIVFGASSNIFTSWRYKVLKNDVFRCYVIISCVPAVSTHQYKYDKTNALEALSWLGRRREGDGDGEAQDASARRSGFTSARTARLGLAPGIGSRWRPGGVPARRGRPKDRGGGRGRPEAVAVAHGGAWEFRQPFGVDEPRERRT